MHFCIRWVFALFSAREEQRRRALPQPRGGTRRGSSQERPHPTAARRHQQQGRGALWLFGAALAPHISSFSLFNTVPLHSLKSTVSC